MNLDDFYTLLCAIGIVLLIPLIIITPIYFLNKWACERQYDNSYYWFYEGCMLKYEDKYIPEKLYIKAFEQKLKIVK